MHGTWATRQTRREAVRSTLLTKRKWKNNTACNSNVCKLLFNSSLSDFEKSRYAVQTFTISKEIKIYIMTKQINSINVAMMPKSNSRNCSWTNYVKIHVYQKIVFGHNSHKTIFRHPRDTQYNKIQMFLNSLENIIEL